MIVNTMKHRNKIRPHTELELTKINRLKHEFPDIWEAAFATASQIVPDSIRVRERVALARVNRAFRSLRVREK
jgi:hypothetical protein